jgi:D-serine deaminase-like pyridoxal phosphate-dependent protein
MPVDYLPLPGTAQADLDTPCLVIELGSMERNIEKMASFLRKKGVALRPHAKTPKCPAICLKQINAGAIGVCASKLGEAEDLAAHGIRDIFITNEVVGPVKIARLMALCHLADAMVAVDDAVNVSMLSGSAQKFGAQLRVAVDVNVRINRCGVEPGEAAVRLASQVADSPGLVFSGVMGYEGAVRPLDFEQRASEDRRAMEKLLLSKELIERAGMPVKIVSGGSTATWNITSTILGITEIQAGTYVLMDGSYKRHTPDFENALFLIATVISRPAKGRAIIDTGLTALSTDEGMPDVVAPADASLDALDQEHGYLTLRGDAERLRVGDKITILPRHGDTTINLHRHYFGIRSGMLETVFEISGSGRFR